MARFVPVIRPRECRRRLPRSAVWTSLCGLAYFTSKHNHRIAACRSRGQRRAPPVRVSRGRRGGERACRLARTTIAAIQPVRGASRRATFRRGGRSRRCANTARRRGLTAAATACRSGNERGETSMSASQRRPFRHLSPSSARSQEWTRNPRARNAEGRICNVQQQRRRGSVSVDLQRALMVTVNGAAVARANRWWVLTERHWSGGCNANPF